MRNDSTILDILLYNCYAHGVLGLLLIESALSGAGGGYTWVIALADGLGLLLLGYLEAVAADAEGDDDDAYY